jgi:dTDP-4-dehydrorhamnose 3,5-epimerase
MPFEFITLDIPGPLVIESRVFSDPRGSFVEIYRHSDFARAGIREHFVQDNYSRSSKGVLRGLHYQKDPHAQGKLVRCVKGRVYDVIVDIRSGSPTFAKWMGIELSEDNGLMFYVPPGFAHGFVVLSGQAEFLYKCTDEYSPENDRGIIWNDPSIGIDWPAKKPLLSDKDRSLPLLREADITFRYRP